MKQRNLLGYLVLLLAAYAVGLVGTLATGWMLLGRPASTVAAQPSPAQTPVVAPQPSSPAIAFTIDC